MQVEIRHILVLPESLETLVQEALAWLRRNAAAPAAARRSDDDTWLTRHALGDLLETPPIAPPAAVLERVEATLDTAAPDPIGGEVAVEEPPATVVWTTARVALLEQRWPSGEATVDAVMAELNALPGTPIAGKQQVYNQASKLGLKRPIIRPEVKPAPAPAAAEVRPPPVAVKRQPVRFAHERAAATLPPPVAAPRLKTADQIKRDTQQAEVDRFIATRGVKQCPVAAADVTTAKLPTADRAALRAHTEQLEAARLAEHQRRMDNKKLSRAGRASA